MSKTYYLNLSRSDSAQVSRFPGSEFESNPCMEWLETVFIPALCALTEGKASKPVQGPLTFWVTVAGALFPEPRQEIFIYSTPSNVVNPVAKALRPVAHSDICEATVYLPVDAVPCCQIFRGKLLRFYQWNQDTNKPETPAIHWGRDQPVLAWTQLDTAFIVAENSKGPDPARVRAKVVGEGRRKDGWPGEGPTGDYCRSMQRRLPGLVIGEDGRS